MKKFDQAIITSTIKYLNSQANSNNGKISSDIVRALAARNECSERTIWNWIKNGVPERKKSNVLTNKQLEEIAFTHGNLKRAWENLNKENGYKSGYRQFVRAVHNLDPVIRDGIRFGVPAGIQQGLYLKSRTESRLDRVIFDHTEADIRIQRLEEGKLETFRPWISLMIDSGTRFILAAVITVGDGMGGDPNTESLVSLMATAIRGQEAADGTFVGGIPRLVQCDNAKAHMADAMLSGFLELRIASKFIAPASPWEDGKVERLMRTFNEEFLATLPGYTGVLPNRYNKDPWVAQDCLSLAEFNAAFTLWIDQYNYERIHSTLQSTPFEAWRNDTTLIERADDAQIRHAFLGSSKPRRVSKNGVRFEKVDYTNQSLAKIVGEIVTLKYLPNDRSFVDVMFNGNFFCTAIPHSQLDEQDRRIIVRTRHSQTRKVDEVMKVARVRASRKAIEGNPLLSPQRDLNEEKRPKVSVGEDEYLSFLEQTAVLNQEGS